MDKFLIEIFTKVLEIHFLISDQLELRASKYLFVTMIAITGFTKYSIKSRKKTANNTQT